MVPVVYHPRYRTYNFGPEHPFSPIRLEMLPELLEALGHPLDPVLPEPATREDLLTVHSETLLAQVEAASRGEPRPDAREYGLDTMDVPVFEGMDEAARYLVGGTLHAARMVASGAARRVLQLGGGLHHARRHLASGFCVYNDLAVAIAACRRMGQRVAYVDIDVHHGDGVQWLHYDDPGVLTISLHETGRYLYPGTGAVHELGEGGGKGFKLNVPLEPYTTDDSYLAAFEHVVPHALAWFQPDLLIAECGVDAHFEDPLADLLLTSRAYERLFHRLLQMADDHTEGRLVLTLGGGYDPDATVRMWTLLYLVVQGLPIPEQIPSAWLDRWELRLGRELTPTLHDPPQDFGIPRRQAIAQQNHQVCQRLIEMASPHWY